MKVFTFLIFTMLFMFISTESICCEACTIEPTKKNYSIDTIFDRCLECCIAPDKYLIYHIFESSPKEITVD